MGFNSVALQSPPPHTTPHHPRPLYKGLNLPWMACYLVCSGHEGFGNHWSTPRNTLFEASVSKSLTDNKSNMEKDIGRLCCFRKACFVTAMSSQKHSLYQHEWKHGEPPHAQDTIQTDATRKQHFHTYKVVLLRPGISSTGRQPRHRHKLQVALLE